MLLFDLVSKNEIVESFLVHKNGIFVIDWRVSRWIDGKQVDSLLTSPLDLASHQIK